MELALHVTQAVLAREQRLGDMQRQLHPRGLPGGQEGEAGGEGHACGHRRGRRQPVAQRRQEGVHARQGQGPGPERQDGGCGDGHDRHQRRMPPGQAGSRQGRRGDQQQGEGVGHPAGEEQHHGQLEHVEAKLQHHFGVGGQPAAAAHQAHAEVHRRADAHQGRPEDRPRLEAQHQADEGEHQDLAGDADPADHGEGLEPQSPPLDGRTFGALALQHRIRSAGRDDRRRQGGVAHGAVP